MTTTTRFFGLGGWIRCAAVAMSIVLCAAAFGDPSSKVAPKQKQTKKLCYTYIGNSAIAQPCDRLGPIPTTSAPMIIIGNSKGESVR